jgi:hypothetical protein
MEPIMDIPTHPWQLGVLCFLAGFLLARWIYRRNPAATASLRADISDTEIEAALRAGHKVDAIRLCRQKYGYDLKTALDATNAMSAKLGLHT